MSRVVVMALICLAFVTSQLTKALLESHLRNRDPFGLETTGVHRHFRKLIWIFFTLLKRMSFFPADKNEMFAIIAEHCLPKLVCELFSRPPYDDSLSDSERNLMSMIGASTFAANPSKFHHAANFGQLIRGVESQTCQNFYPQCPFTGEEVRMIARKVKLR